MKKADKKFIAYAAIVIAIAGIIYLLATKKVKIATGKISEIIDGNKGKRIWDQNPNPEMTQTISFENHQWVAQVKYVGELSDLMEVIEKANPSIGRKRIALLSDGRVLEEITIWGTAPKWQVIK